MSAASHVRHFTPEGDPKLFRCQCGRKECEAPPPSRILLLTLDLMRDAYGAPLVATSGPRCAWWNLHEEGDPKSEHLYGDGADLICVGSAVRWKMLDAAKAAGFRRVGIGRIFLHVGVSTRQEHPADVVWDYYPKPNPSGAAA